MGTDKTRDPEASVGSLAPVVEWLMDDQLAAIATAAGWNDPRQDGWAPHQQTPAQILDFLSRETSNLAQLEAALRFSADCGFNIRGTGLEPGAGVCWASALLSRRKEVSRIFAVDISRHRLEDMAPRVLATLDADVRKICRVLGSFYCLRLPDRSVDFCLMAQAFHHAEHPHRLLAELARVLKPSGVILMIGEAPIGRGHWALKYVKNLIKMVMPGSMRARYSPPVYKLLPSFEELFVTDPILGDRFYRKADLWRLFTDRGFVLRQRRSKRFSVFVAVPLERRYGQC